MTQTTDLHSSALDKHAARLGPNHGYRIEGDIALLHADISLDRELDRREAHWALQLWACDTPFDGGALSGLKIAEAPLPLSEDTAEPKRMDAEALASVPGGQRDYNMVLVLASGAPGAFTQIHDFANYPARERFVAPHLEGSVGYQVDGAHVTLCVEGIRNPRDESNLSGSLALELWALPAPYAGGNAFEGSILASADLGRLAGTATLQSLEQRVRFSAPAAGSWNVVLMLREWVAGGYVTRDSCNFPELYRVQETAAPNKPEPVAELRAEETAAASEPEPVLELRAEEAAAPSDPEPVLELRVEVTAAPSDPEPVLEPRAEETAASGEPMTVAELRVEEAAASSDPEPVLELRVEVTAAPSDPEPVLELAIPTAAVSSDSPTHERDVSATTPGSIATPLARTLDGRVSIMHATIEDLARVKGLTRKIAVEIVKGRPYTSLDELVRVRGIGPKLLVKLRPYLAR